MKKYGLRYLYRHLGKILRKRKNFKITNHNKVVAVVKPVKEK